MAVGSPGALRLPARVFRPLARVSGQALLEDRHQIGCGFLAAFIVAAEYDDILLFLLLFFHQFQQCGRRFVPEFI